MHGIKSVRMDDIAHTLGVSKRTLYELFGDKEELLYLCMKHNLDKQRAEVNAQAGVANNTLEAILLGFFNMMQYSEANNRIMNNLRKFYPNVFDRVHNESGSAGRETFRNAVHKCVNEGYIDSRFNMDLAITVLYYSAMGVVARREISYPDGMSPRDAFAHIVICFFRGISTPKGMKIIDDFIEAKEIKI